MPSELVGRRAGVAKLNDLVISLTVVFLPREAGKRCQVFGNKIIQDSRANFGVLGPHGAAWEPELRSARSGGGRGWALRQQRPTHF